MSRYIEQIFGIPDILGRGLARLKLLTRILLQIEKAANTGPDEITKPEEEKNNNNLVQ